jgi:hypothetical protein
MVGIVHNPWRRIGLRAVILALLGALVLAGSARAAEPGVGAILPEAAGSVPETVLSGPTPVAAPETILSSGSGPEAATPPAELTPPSSSLPPVVKPPETAPPAAPPAAETAPPAAPPAPETVQLPTAPEALTPPATPEAVLSTISGQAKTPTPETVLSGAAGAGKEQETLVLGSVSGDQGSVLVLTPVGGGPQPPPGGPTAGSGLPEVANTSSAGRPTLGAAAKMTVAQRVRQFDCDLSSLGEHAASGCSAGWLGAQRLLSPSPAGLGATAASVAASAGPPPTGGGHGGSGPGSPPVNPAPGPTPAPSGASGSAAGSSGIALSGFLTLAGLLLLGAPRAMRRLRLSCQPWRTACFVLIPERPG